MSPAGANNRQGLLFGKKLSLAILLVVSFFQYAHVIGYDFVWDSKDVFLEDPSIRSVKYFSSYFTTDFGSSIPYEGGQASTLKYYRPLVKILHLIEFSVFKEKASGYKAVNVLLSSAVVLVLFLLVQSLTQSVSVALVSALLYAVNPMRVEVVAWAYSDSHLLVALFSLLTLYYCNRGNNILALAIFVLALLSQEIAILLPIILLLHELLLKRVSIVRGLLRTGPFWGLVVLYLFIRRAAVGGSVQMTQLDILPLLNTWAVIIKRYVKIFFVPDAPITIYRTEIFHAISPEVMVSYAVCAGLLLFGGYLWRRGREYLFWYLWFFVWIVVAFNVGTIGHYMMAEKIINLSGIGFCVLFALFLSGLKDNRALYLALIAVAFFSHAAMTYSRSFHWKNTRSYLEKAVAFVPDFYLVHFMLGMIYVEDNDIDKALESFQATVRLDPSLSYAHNSIGNIYYMKNNKQLALNAWLKSIGVDPKNPVPYYNVGMIFEQNGDYQKANQYFQKFLQHSESPDAAAVSHLLEFEKKFHLK